MLRAYLLDIQGDAACLWGEKHNELDVELLLFVGEGAPKEDGLSYQLRELHCVRHAGLVRFAEARLDLAEDCPRGPYVKDKVFQLLRKICNTFHLLVDLEGILLQITEVDKGDDVVSIAGCGGDV